MQRRHFLATAGLGLPMLGSATLFAQDTLKPPKPEQLAPELVKEFVRIGHNKLRQGQRMNPTQNPCAARTAVGTLPPMTWRMMSRSL